MLSNTPYNKIQICEKNYKSIYVESESSLITLFKPTWRKPCEMYDCD